MFFLALLILLLSAASAAAVTASIDVNSERMLTLSQLARRLPCRRSDRPVNPATVHRWRNPGIRGVRLPCVKIGGIWHTSLEAYQRWVERLTAASEPPVASTTSVPSAPSVSTDNAQSDVERRLQELDPIDGADDC